MTRICVWGDSIAWGECDHKELGWVNRLKQEMYSLKKKVYNASISGDNSEKLIKRFEVECIARKPEIIIFAIGVNDSQYSINKDNPRVSLEEYEKNMQEAITIAKRMVDRIICVGLTKVVESKVMPIQWDTTKYYDNENIKLYDEKLKLITTKQNISYVHMFDLLNEKKDFEDGLHPNAKGHEKMFLRMRDFLKNY